MAESTIRCETRDETTFVGASDAVVVHPRARERLEQRIRERRTALRAAKRQAAVKICNAIARLCAASAVPDPARLALIAELMYGLSLCLGDPGPQDPDSLAKGKADWCDAKNRLEKAVARDRAGSGVSC